MHPKLFLYTAALGGSKLLIDYACIKPLHVFALQKAANTVPSTGVKNNQDGGGVFPQLAKQATPPKQQNSSQVFACTPSCWCGRS